MCMVGVGVLFIEYANFGLCGLCSDIVYFICCYDSNVVILFYCKREYLVKSWKRDDTKLNLGSNLGTSMIASCTE